MSAPVSDFKRSVQESTQVPAWGKAPKQPKSSNPQSTQSQASSSTARPSSPAPGPKKKKHKSDTVFSQPLDTGTGKQKGTQLAFVFNTLKESKNPMRLEDLAMTSKVPALLHDEDLLKVFESEPNVVKNAINGLYEWKRTYLSRTPEQLLHEIKTRGRDGTGLSLKNLMEGFPEAMQHVEELERQGRVLVTRGGKDNSPKFVFWNEITAEQGGKQVEEEFRTMWHNLKLPTEVELLKFLEAEGMQASTSEALVKDAPKKKSKKAKVVNRNTKISNTHVAGIDLTKDYVKPK